MAFEQLPVNGFRICIDNLTTDIAGTAYTPLEKDAITFDSFSKLLLHMDRSFDAVGYPEAFQEKRSFGGKEAQKGSSFHGLPQAILTTEEIRKNSGSVATVEVIVNSRRNTSWQGRMFIMDTDISTVFSSEVELLNCILESFRH